MIHVLRVLVFLVIIITVGEIMVIMAACSKWPYIVLHGHNLPCRCNWALKPNEVVPVEFDLKVLVALVYF